MESPIKRKSIVPKNVTVHLLFESVKIVQKNSELSHRMTASSVQYPVTVSIVVKQSQKNIHVKL